MVTVEEQEGPSARSWKIRSSRRMLLVLPAILILAAAISLWTFPFTGGETINLSFKEVVTNENGEVSHVFELKNYAWDLDVLNPTVFVPRKEFRHLRPKYHDGKPIWPSMRLEHYAVAELDRPGVVRKGESILLQLQPPSHTPWMLQVTCLRVTYSGLKVRIAALNRTANQKLGFPLIVVPEAGRNLSSGIFVNSTSEADFARTRIGNKDPGATSKTTP